MTILTLFIAIGMLVTLVSLASGITSMGHGGTFDRKHELQFMSTRVVAQAVTILCVLAAIYFATR